MNFHLRSYISDAYLEDVQIRFESKARCYIEAFYECNYRKVGGGNFGQTSYIYIGEDPQAYPDHAIQPKGQDYQVWKYQQPQRKTRPPKLRRSIKSLRVVGVNCCWKIAT